MKKTISPLTLEKVDRAARKISVDIAALTRSLQAEIKVFRDGSALLRDVLSADDQSIGALKGALSRLRERIATAASIEDKLGNLSEEFPCADLVVSANAVSAVAVNLQTSLGQERQDRKVHVELEKRRKQLESQLKQNRARLIRLKRAFDTLSNLMKNNSLQDEMNAALLQNKESIETIFSQIHPWLAQRERCWLGLLGLNAGLNSEVDKIARL